jgi:4-hydroxy-tetrahydrodipicolinate reductase
MGREGVVKIFVMGANGRMGRELILALKQETSLFAIGGADTTAGSFADIPIMASDNDFAELLNEAEMIVDFSSPSGTEQMIEHCGKYELALLTGTTGLQENQQKKLEKLAHSVPVLQAANFSVGIAILKRLVGETGKTLPHADVEISEAHHRKKKDAPSGTALMFGEVLRHAQGKKKKDIFLFGRSKEMPERGEEIVFHSIRGGNVPGEHNIRFFFGDEEICITHRSLSRRIFVAGAIAGIHFLAGKKAGLYTMEDVLNGN